MCAYGGVKLNRANTVPADALGIPKRYYRPTEEGQEKAR